MSPAASSSAADVREVAAPWRRTSRQARAHGCSRVRVVATAAVRQAVNRAALCAAVRGLGVAVEVLSEAQEAAFAFARGDGGHGW